MSTPTCKIGDSNGACGRQCQTCIPISERCKTKRCPSYPVVKEFHQGIIMSGNGAPPNSIPSAYIPPFPVGTDQVADNPVPQCFYYKYFYDFENNRFYSLEKDLNGKDAGYTVLSDGLDVLNSDFRILSAGNIGAQGTVLSSATLLSLQACLNARAAAGSSFAVAGSGNAVLQKFNCAINASNQGSLGFVYMDAAPSPEALAFLRTNAGYTATPDYVLTSGGTPFGSMDYLWTVYVRDKRNNRYYRDTYNSPVNDPDFPPNNVQPLRPCNGDLWEFGTLTFEFDASTCRWYILSDSNVFPTDPIGGNPSLVPLADLDCRCKCGDEEPPCADNCDCCNCN